MLSSPLYMWMQLERSKPFLGSNHPISTQHTVLIVKCVIFCLPKLDHCSLFYHFFASRPNCMSPYMCHNPIRYQVFNLANPKNSIYGLNKTFKFSLFLNKKKISRKLLQLKIYVLNWSFSNNQLINISTLDWFERWKLVIMSSYLAWLVRDV